MNIYKVCAALLITGAIAGPALADGEKNIEIVAEVTPSCTFSPLAGSSSAANDRVVLAIGNGKHAGANSTSAMTPKLRLTCNQAFVVSLESEQGAVRRKSVANGGSGDADTPILGGSMAKAIAYSATPRLTDLDTNAFTPEYDTLTADVDLLLGEAPANLVRATNAVRAIGGGADSGGAYDGTLEIDISTMPSPLLVAGSYRDTLKVILTAQ